MKEQVHVNGLIVAIYNSDIDGVLLQLFEKEVATIYTKILSRAKEGQEKIVILPEYAFDQQVETIKAEAKKYGITVTKGFVDVFKYEHYKIIHPLELVEDAKSYISLDGYTLVKVSQDNLIREIFPQQDIKGFITGCHIYGKEILDKKLVDINVENGILIPILEKHCIIQEVEKRLSAYRTRSCGKCVFCREGLIQLHYMQKEMIEGKGKVEYLDLSKEIATAMKISTPCSMGQNCSHIVIDAIELFEEEYTEHIKKKQCRANCCTSFVNIYIDPQTCDGCEECVDVCPRDCIVGKPKYIHMIDEFECDKCGKCIEICEQKAIIITTDKVPKLPDKITKCGKFKKR